MGEIANTLKLDVDFETARVLHRVVRSMHDGECPKCHVLVPSNQMRFYRLGTKTQNGSPFDLVCPKCKFTIPYKVAQAAIATFAPMMEKCLEIFENWRQDREKGDE